MIKMCSALLLVLILVPSTSLAEKSKGQLVYEGFCIVCHGPEGRGDGPSAFAMIPPPPDFSTGDYWAVKDPNVLWFVIKDGRPGTQMESFGQKLSGPEIHSVLDYILSLYRSE